MKLFSENTPNILAKICPGACAIKYCSSSSDTISVSTSHMLRRGGEALSRAEPPAGPPKLELLQFSCKDPEIFAKTAPNAKVGKTSSERTKLEREHHDPRPVKGSFSARKIFLHFSLAPSEAKCIYLHFGSFSANSDGWIARYLHFCEIIFRKCA